jgi:Emfourin
MRIRLETEGGFAAFPGLNRPIEVDTAQLPAAEAAELDHLVDGARFFEQPAITPAPPGAADYRQYTITVERPGRTHTVRVADPIGDSALAALVTRLQALRR